MIIQLALVASDKCCDVIFLCLARMCLIQISGTCSYLKDASSLIRLDICSYQSTEVCVELTSIKPLDASHEHPPCNCAFLLTRSAVAIATSSVLRSLAPQIWQTLSSAPFPSRNAYRMTDYKDLFSNVPIIPYIM